MPIVIIYLRSTKSFCSIQYGHPAARELIIGGGDFELIFFDVFDEKRRGLAQQRSLDLGIGLDCRIEIAPCLIDGRTNMGIRGC